MNISWIHLGYTHVQHNVGVARVEFSVIGFVVGNRSEILKDKSRPR